MRVAIWLVVGLGLVAGMAACSSDEFGVVGGSLPLDVSQDSLKIIIEGIAPVEFMSVEVNPDPAANPSYPVPSERQLLYMGTRPDAGWDAAPVFVFDFTTVAADAEDYDPNAPLSSFATGIRLFMIEDDAFKTISRTIDVYELQADLGAIVGAGSETELDQLVADLQGQPRAAILGNLITSIVMDGSPNSYLIKFEESIVRGWINDAQPVGLVLVSRDEFVTSSDDVLKDIQHFMVAVSSLNASSAAVQLLAPIRLGELSSNVDAVELLFQEAFPEVEAEQTGTGLFFNVRPILDFTHFTVPVAYESAARFESHRRESRIFTRFDLGGVAVPSNATINSATLRLTVDTANGLGRDIVERIRTIVGDTNNNNECDTNIIDDPDTEEDESESSCVVSLDPRYSQTGLSLLVSSSTLDELQSTTDPNDLDRVLGALAGVDPFLEEDGSDSVIEIDVADFIQRQVNGIFDPLNPGDPEVGLTLAVQANVLFLRAIPFHGVDATDPSKRPQLEIVFTPPADSWR